MLLRTQGLLGLRAVTRRLRAIPGMVVLLDVVRRYFKHHTSPILVTDFDNTIRLAVRLDEHMGSQIFWFGCYSLEILRVLDRLLAPGMVVVDAGANIGEVSLFAAKRVLPAGHVFSFEPMPELAKRLREHVELNGFTGMEVIERGLADREGKADLYAPRNPWRDGTMHDGLATLYASADRGGLVGSISLTTLDAFVNQRGLQRVDILKVDVEGSELPVLRGAREVLAAHRPWVIVEVQEETSAAAGYRQSDILTYLGGLGYRFARIARRGRLDPLTAESLANFQNVLGIPPGKRIPGLA
jgi:FkbM family methyltransferase